VKDFLKLAVQPAIVRRSLAYAAVVGSILIAINHADVIRHGHLTTTTWLKMAMTAAVPYCVSTLSSIQALRQKADVNPTRPHQRWEV